MSLKKLSKFFLIAAGNALLALTVQLFLTSSGLITGGATGLALFVSRLTGLSTSLAALIINGVFLIIGWLTLGREFALNTVLSTILFPAFLNLFEHFLGGVILTEDLVLNAVYAGLGVGTSLALVLRSGASTGGMDIPPLLLHKYWNIPVSVSMYVFDFIILIMQLPFSGVEDVLYGLLSVLFYTVTLDQLMIMGSARTEVRIVSSQSDKIRRLILAKLDRGVTMADARGGYSGEKQEIVVTVISNRELPRLEEIVHSVDPDCFMVINRVSEVRGRGFTKSKRAGGKQIDL
jgi:uncharacterized membrane-anchored protein YitT (DUF2179 family)